jgi:hypothetical protein
LIKKYGRKIDFRTPEELSEYIKERSMAESETVYEK